MPHGAWIADIFLPQMAATGQICSWNGPCRTFFSCFALSNTGVALVFSTILMHASSDRKIWECDNNHLLGTEYIILYTLIPPTSSRSLSWQMEQSTAALQQCVHAHREISSWQHPSRQSFFSTDLRANAQLAANKFPCLQASSEFVKLHFHVIMIVSENAQVLMGVHFSLCYVCRSLDTLHKFLVVVSRLLTLSDMHSLCCVWSWS